MSVSIERFGNGIIIYGEGEEAAVIIKTPSGKEEIFLPKNSGENGLSIYDIYSLCQVQEKFVRKIGNKFEVSFLPEEKGEHKISVIFKNENEVKEFHFTKFL